MSNPVVRRAVFFVGGYDPKSPSQFFSRMRKEAGRFEALWGQKVTMSDIDSAADGRVGTVTLQTVGPHGEGPVVTSFSFLVLDGLVLADFARPLPIRLAKYLAAFADFVVSGTALRIFARAWRFGLYFLYPFLVLTAFLLVALAAGWAGTAWLGLASWILVPILFFLLLATLGERWSVTHLMDLWSFSSAFIHGRRSDADALMTTFADAVTETAGQGAFDEILLVGHSTGGLLILDIAAKCLERAPDFCERASHVSVLTLGSTALKAGLHPNAVRFRAGLQRLIAEPRLEWLEIQCLTDVINFYKSDPVADSGLARRADFPLVRQVRMKDMLEAATYRRIKRNFFRVHYQYIFGNTKPYWFDFFQLCLGPMSAVERARTSTAGWDRPTPSHEP